MRVILAAAVAAGAFATPAYAQPEAGVFTGGHIEIITGVDYARAEGDEEDGGDSTTTGLLYGLAGGFDFQSGNLVFGVEGEASESTSELCEEGLCVDASRDLYIGGRVGTVLNNVGLLYFKAGYTNARISLASDVEDDDDDLDDDETLASTNLDGIRAGVGVELATGTPINVKVEYRYSNYENDFARHQGVVGLGIRF